MARPPVPSTARSVKNTGSGTPRWLNNLELVVDVTGITAILSLTALLFLKAHVPTAYTSLARLFGW